MIVQISITIIFVILGILFMNGKGLMFIAGYNGMSKTERDKVDGQALGKLMGKAMFCFALSFALWTLSDVLVLQWLSYIGTMLFIATLIFILVYPNTANRFRKH